MREDYPKRDDENFMVHTMAYLTGDPESAAKEHIKLGTKPVVVTNYPPTERKY
jgi:succinate dehydrogenase / fumarate reductase flavoprotein subunit